MPRLSRSEPRVLALPASAAARVVLVAWLCAVAARAPAAAAGIGVPSWQPIGPSGGVVLGLAVDPAAPLTAYAAGGGGGLFKSVDGGGHWAHRDAGLLPNYVVGVAIDPATSRIYALTLLGLWSSADGGATWVGSSLGAGAVTALVFDPRTPGTLYAAKGNRVWKSRDGGGSWSDSGAGLPPAAFVISLAIEPLRPARLYAGTTRGVFRSVDRGVTWQPARAQIGTAQVLALAADPLVRGTIYAGVAPSPSSPSRGVWVSADGGTTWIHRKAAAPAPCIVAPAGAPHTVYACVSGQGLFRSTDGGLSWQVLDNGLHPLGADFGSLAAAPSSPDRLYIGVDRAGNGGPAAATSTDAGASWMRADEGIETVSLSALAADPSLPGLVYAGTPFAGLFATSDGGAHWAPDDNGLDGSSILALAADPLLPETVYVETDHGFFVSHDGAQLWMRPGAFFAGTPPLVAVPGTAATLYSFGPRGTGGTGLFETGDGGVTWVGKGGAVGMPDALAVAPSAPSTLYLASAGFLEGHRVSVLEASADGGATFRLLPTSFRFVFALAVDPAAAGTLYIGARDDTGDGLWKSTDGGQTVSRLLAAGPVAALAFDPEDPSALYAAVGFDVDVTHDGGATWQQAAPGLPGAPVVKLAFGAGGTLYAGTDGASVYRLAP